MNSLCVKARGPTVRPLLAPAAAVLICLTTMAGAAQAQLRFKPLAPCRIADTRNPTGPFGGPAISPGAPGRSFVIPNSPCLAGVPATVAAYSLNVTAVPAASSLGYLTIWPTGQSQPLVSTLNSYDGRYKANAAIVPAGTGGAISVYVTDATHVVLDINGYFLPANDASAPLAFFPLTPCRVVDTRNLSGPLGGPTLSAQQTRSFPVLSSSCNIPATAQAYSLNFTAVPHGPLGYLTTWPTGMTQPLVSTLNALTGTVTANAAIVPAGNGGAISVYVKDESDVVIDINGYFAPSTSGSGLSLYTVAPCRVMDTREASGSFSGQINEDMTASACGIPAGTQAVVLNATVVPSQTLGFLTLWPHGQTQPLVSTLNAYDGLVTSNMAIVPTSSSGVIDAFATDWTHLILDTSGFFLSGTGPPPASFTGNWEINTASSAVPGVTSEVQGSIVQAGSSITGVLHVLGSSCFDSNTNTNVAGTITGSSVTITSSPVGGQVVNFAGTVTGTTLSGTYSISGGCAGGDHGTLNGFKVPSLSGSWSGSFTSFSGPSTNVSAALTQWSPFADGSFGLSGTAGFQGSSCFTSGTITPGAITSPVGSGSSIIGTFLWVEINTSNGQVVFFGDVTQAGNQISGIYEVNGGSCDGDAGTGTMNKS